MTLEEKRARNQRIVTRAQETQRRNVPKIAQEFGLSRAHVDRILRGAGVPGQRTEARP